MFSFNRKVALGMGTVSVLLAGLAGTAAGLIWRENAEDTLVTLAVEQSRRLLQHEAFRPEGAQAMMHAQAAAQALVGGVFDIARIYAADGVLMTGQMSPAGRALEDELVPHAPPAYPQAFYERQQLPGDRWLLRVFVPLRSADQALTGYLEGVRLVPQWQRELIRSDALKVALMVALATLLCGGALYPVVIRLLADSQRETRAVLDPPAR